MNKLILLFFWITVHLAQALQFNVLKRSDCTETNIIIPGKLPESGNEICLTSSEMLLVAGSQGPPSPLARAAAKSIGLKIFQQTWKSQITSISNHGHQLSKLGKREFKEMIDQLTDEGKNDHFSRLSDLIDMARLKNKARIEFKEVESRTSLRLSVVNIRQSETGSFLQIYRRGDSAVAIFRKTPNARGGFYYTLAFATSTITPSSSPLDRPTSPEQKGPRDYETAEALGEIREVPLQEHDIVVVGSIELFDVVPLTIMAFSLNMRIMNVLQSDKSKDKSRSIIDRDNQRFLTRLKKTSQNLFERIKQNLKSIMAKLQIMIEEKFGKVTKKSIELLSRMREDFGGEKKVFKREKAANKKKRFPLPDSPKAMRQEHQVVLKSEPMAESVSQIDVPAGKIKFYVPPLPNDPFANYELNGNQDREIGNNLMEGDESPAEFQDFSAMRGEMLRQPDLKQATDFFDLSAEHQPLAWDADLGNGDGDHFFRSNFNQNLFERRLMRDEGLDIFESFAKSDGSAYQPEINSRKKELDIPDEIGAFKQIENLMNLDVEELLNLNCGLSEADCEPRRQDSDKMSATVDRLLMQEFSFSTGDISILEEGCLPIKLSYGLSLAAFANWKLSKYFPSLGFMLHSLGVDPRNVASPLQNNIAIAASLVVSRKESLPENLSRRAEKAIFNGLWQFYREHGSTILKELLGKPLKIPEKREEVLENTLANLGSHSGSGFESTDRIRKLPRIHSSFEWERI